MTTIHVKPRERGKWPTPRWDVAVDGKHVGYVSKGEAWWACDQSGVVVAVDHPTQGRAVEALLNRPVERRRPTQRAAEGADLETAALLQPWRVGRTLGFTMYAQQGNLPTTDDVYLGAMDTPDLARLVVTSHNLALPRPLRPGTPSEEQQRQARHRHDQ